MKRKMLAAVLWPLSFVLIGAWSPAHAQSFHRIATIEVPGAPLKAFDISWVDKNGKKYYLADRSNAGIDIFDARGNTFEGRIGGFVGFTGDNDTSGPNGVVVIDNRHELWAGDGNSTVKVIDLHSGQIVDSINTHGMKRADELAYDPRDRIVLVANDAEEPPSVPYVSFIDQRSHQILGTLSFPDATDGIEQPVWDPGSGNFLQAVPETPTNPGGEIAVIDPSTMQRVDTFRIPLEATGGRKCNPHGLALGPGHDLLLGCSAGGANAQSIIMDARNGNIVAVITQVGGSDQVWFNPGDDNYYLAARNNPGGPVLGVIDAVTRTWVQNVATAPRAHSVAASRHNNEIFVPLDPLPADPACTRGCIGVYAAED